MRILDIDMDYFMNTIANNIVESTIERLDESYDEYVWSKSEVQSFIENNLGLSKN